jgi:uncharacterized coiled-coil protein SlyX
VLQEQFIVGLSEESKERAQKIKEIRERLKQMHKKIQGRKEQNE